MNNNGSGLGSIFATMARSIPQKDDQSVVVICTECKSDDTKPVDFEHDIYECTSCGEVFTRQPQEA